MPSKIFLSIPIMISICLALGQAVMAQQVSLHFFDTNHDRLSEREQVKLDSVIAHFRNIPMDSVHVSGHTDLIGQSDFNLELSKRRMQFVIAQLGEFPSVSGAYKGETVPLLKQSHPDGQSKNRRVEITWYVKRKPEAIRVAVVELQESDKDETTGAEAMMAAMFEVMKPVEEVQTFDPAKERVITTANNVKLIVQKDAFRNAKGEVPKEVNLTIKEYFDLSTLIGDRVTCLTTKGTLLETGGMMHLSARNEKGEELFLQKSMTVMMPGKTDDKADMQLYQGVEKNGEVKWTLAENPNYVKPRTLDKKSLAENALVLASATNRDAGRTITKTRNTVRKTNEIVKTIPRSKKAKLGRLDIRIYLEALATGQSIGEVRNIEMSNYFFTVTQMGYINSDRVALEKIPGSRVTVSVTVGVDAGVRYYLVFNGINSYLEADLQTGNTFRRIPAGVSVTLLAFASTRNEMRFGMVEVVASTELVQMELTATTEAEFKAVVTGLMRL
jgi:hypothetical protein